MPVVNRNDRNDRGTIEVGMRGSHLFEVVHIQFGCPRYPGAPVIKSTSQRCKNGVGNFHSSDIPM